MNETKELEVLEKNEMQEVNGGEIPLSTWREYCQKIAEGIVNIFRP